MCFFYSLFFTLNVPVYPCRYWFSGLWYFKIRTIIFNAIMITRNTKILYTLPTKIFLWKSKFWFGIDFSSIIIIKRVIGTNANSRICVEFENFFFLLLHHNIELIKMLVSFVLWISPRIIFQNPKIYRCRRTLNNNSTLTRPNFGHTHRPILVVNLILHCIVYILYVPFLVGPISFSCE